MTSLHRTKARKPQTINEFVVSREEGDCHLVLQMIEGFGGPIFLGILNLSKGPSGSIDRGLFRLMSSSIDVL